MSSALQLLAQHGLGPHIRQALIDAQVIQFPVPVMPKPKVIKVKGPRKPYPKRRSTRIYTSVYRPKWQVIWQGRREAGACVRCGAPAVIVDGKPLKLCDPHRVENAAYVRGCRVRKAARKARRRRASGPRVTSI